MKTTNNYTGKEIDIVYASAHQSGYGHKNIEVEIEYNGRYKKFSATTNDMPGYDDATDLDYEEKNLALYQLIESKIDERVAEWIYEENN